MQEKGWTYSRCAQTYKSYSILQVLLCKMSTMHLTAATFYSAVPDIIPYKCFHLVIIKFNSHNVHTL